jgi:hypothetical protein
MCALMVLSFLLSLWNSSVLYADLVEPFEPYKSGETGEFKEPLEEQRHHRAAQGERREQRRYAAEKLHTREREHVDSFYKLPKQDSLNQKPSTNVSRFLWDVIADNLSKMKDSGGQDSNGLSIVQDLGTDVEDALDDDTQARLDDYLKSTANVVSTVCCCGNALDCHVIRVATSTGVKSNTACNIACFQQLGLKSIRCPSDISSCRVIKKKGRVSSTL